VAICAFVCGLTHAAVGSGTGSAISEKRIRLLRELIRNELVKRDGKGSDYRILKAVMGEYRKRDRCPLSPKPDVVTEADCRRASRESTRMLVQKEYPGLDQEKLQAEAAAAFPIYAPGDIVTVTYRANPMRVQTKTGVFHCREGGVLRVGLGGRPILLTDMAGLAGNDVELLKFDEERSTALRKAQIEKKIAAYDAERAAYERKVSDLTLKAEKKNAVQKNEENGYTFYDDEWRSLRDCAALLLGRVRTQMAREATARLKRLQAKHRQEVELSVAFQASFEASLPDYFYRDPKTLFAHAPAPHRS